MKRLVTAIAGLSVLAAGILTPTSAEAIYFGYEHNKKDLKSIVLKDASSDDLQLNYNQRNFLTAMASIIPKTNSATLLKKPNKLNKLYKGNVKKYNPNKKQGTLGVYSKNGCSVDAGCAIKAIGLVNGLKCAGSISNLTDPQDWAGCIQEVDYDAYLAASNCTFGNCPAFATLPNQKVVACNNGVNSTLAGKSYLNLPSTLVSEKKELQITWLSQG